MNKIPSKEKIDVTLSVRAIALIWLEVASIAIFAETLLYQL